jgi:hypothetical protein
VKHCFVGTSAIKLTDIFEMKVVSLWLTRPTSFNLLGIEICRTSQNNRNVWKLNLKGFRLGMYICIYLATYVGTYVHMSSSHLPQNKISRDRILAWLQTFFFIAMLLFMTSRLKLYWWRWRKNRDQYCPAQQILKRCHTPFLSISILFRSQYYIRCAVKRSQNSLCSLFFEIKYFLQLCKNTVAY